MGLSILIAGGPTTHLSLLAQGAERADLKDISKGFNHARWDMPWELLVIGLGLVLVVLVAISATRWWRSRYDNPGPAVLFSAFARKAGLGWGDRLLLWRIARAGKLSSPIALLLARGALMHHSEAFRQRMSPRASKRIYLRVLRIQQHLFD